MDWKIDMAEKGLLTSPSGCRGDESPSRAHHFGHLRAGQREALSMGLETRYIKMDRLSDIPKLSLIASYLREL